VRLTFRAHLKGTVVTHGSSPGHTDGAPRPTFPCSPEMAILYCSSMVFTSTYEVYLFFWFLQENPKPQDCVWSFKPMAWGFPPVVHSPPTTLAQQLHRLLVGSGWVRWLRVRQPKGCSSLQRSLFFLCSSWKTNEFHSLQKWNCFCELPHYSSSRPVESSLPFEVWNGVQGTVQAEVLVIHFCTQRRQFLCAGEFKKVPALVSKTWMS
jgi:hypothetical protein